MVSKTIALATAILLCVLTVFSAQSATVNKNQTYKTESSVVVNRNSSGSLWNSDLFNPSRFMLNIKLTEAEKKEAKRLVNSFESHMEKGAPFMHHLLTELKNRNLPV